MKLEESMIIIETHTKIKMCESIELCVNNSIDLHILILVSVSKIIMDTSSFMDYHTRVMSRLKAF